MKNYSNSKLWEYMHGLLDSAEELEIKEQLQADTGLKKRLNDLTLMESDLKKELVHNAPAGFADKFMAGFSNELNPQTATLNARVNLNYIRVLFGFLILILIVGLLAVITNLDWNSTVETLPVSQFDTVKEFALSKSMTNILVAVLLVSALFFMDQFLSFRKRTISF